MTRRVRNSLTLFALLAIEVFPWLFLDYALILVCWLITLEGFVFVLIARGVQ